jgi:hypothetical protein
MTINASNNNTGNDEGVELSICQLGERKKLIKSGKLPRKQVVSPKDAFSPNG